MGGWEERQTWEVHLGSQQNKASSASGTPLCLTSLGLLSLRGKASLDVSLAYLETLLLSSQASALGAFSPLPFLCRPHSLVEAGLSGELSLPLSHTSLHASAPAPHLPHCRASAPTPLRQLLSLGSALRTLHIMEEGGTPLAALTLRLSLSLGGFSLLSPLPLLHLEVGLREAHSSSLLWEVGTLWEALHISSTILSHSLPTNQKRRGGALISSPLLLRPSLYVSLEHIVLSGGGGTSPLSGLFAPLALWEAMLCLYMEALSLCHSGNISRCSPLRIVPPLEVKAGLTLYLWAGRGHW